MNASDQNAEPRPIWLCADDYGIAPGVSRGIRELVAMGRLNATSVMMVASSLDVSEVAALKSLNSTGRKVAIGLHLTLSGKFKPMTLEFSPTRRGTFVSLEEMMIRGHLGLLNRRLIGAEIETQLGAFVSRFGQLPDFIDGHQHTHLSPQVREVLLDVVRRKAKGCWVRQCGRVPSLPTPAGDFKTRILNSLSRKFRALAAKAGVPTNPAFAGAYSFMSADETEFARLFPGFLEALPAQSVVMCHPGFNDAELERLDPLTTQREREFAYLAGDQFPAALHAQGLVLA